MKSAEQLPGILNITIISGDDYPLDIEIQDNNGNPIDLSVWSNISLQVRQLEMNGGSIHKEYNESDSLNVTPGGRLGVKFKSGETSEWDNYNEYEIEGEDQNGDKRTLVRGQIKVIKEISK